jgi:hypothetical protein
MPRPGNALFNRLKRVKGPVYRHASLFFGQFSPLLSVDGNATNYLLHGSLAGEPDAAASFLGSKPVRLGGAIAICEMASQLRNGWKDIKDVLRVVCVQWLSLG